MFLNCRARIFQVALILLVIITCGANANFNGNEPAVFDEYYLLLKKLNQESSASRIEQLKVFLHAYPNFDRAYLQIWEEYLLSDNVGGAKRYFLELSQQPQHEKYSNWILAKIYQFENKNDSAYGAYIQSLSVGEPSGRIIKDFIEFDHRVGGKFDALKQLKELELPPAQISLGSALHHYFQDRFPEAISIFRKLPKEISHNAEVLHVWARCYFGLLEYTPADSLWNIGLKNSRKYNDPEKEAKFLTCIGAVAQSLHKYHRTLAYYDSALAIAEALGDKNRKQILLGNKASILNDEGRYAQAVGVFEKAIKIADDIGSFEHLALWNLGYGNALRMLQNFYDALRAYDNCAKIADELNNKHLLILVSTEKGNLYSEINQVALEERAFREAYELAQSIDWKNEEFRALTRLMDIFISRGDFGKARNIYSKYIQYLENKQSYLHEMSWWIRSIARTYRLEKKYELARKEYLRAIDAARKAGSKHYVIAFQIELTDMEIELSNLDRAIAMITRIINEVSPKGHNNLLGNAYSSLGDALYQKKELTRATAAYLKAAQVIENQREKLQVEKLKIGYFSRVQQVYRRLAECYFLRCLNSQNMALIDSLYYYSELSRSRVMKDLVFHDAQADIDQSTKPFMEYKEIVNKLCSLQRSLRINPPENSRDPRLAEHEVLRYTLIGQQMRLAQDISFNSQNQNFNFSELIATLGNFNLGLLLYHISQQTSFVLAVANGEYEVVRLPENSNTIAGSIDSLVLPFHNLSPPEIDFSVFRAEIAHNLYESLIKPVEEKIDLNQQVLVIPDRELAKVPFEMLLVNSPSRREYLPSDSTDYAKDFLVNKYSFIYGPTSTLLFRKYPQTTTEPRLLALANPFDKKVFTNNHADRVRAGVPDLSPLPFSELEAHKIKSAYPETQVYKREQATQEHLLESSGRANTIIHIATHAFVDSTFDAFSGLVLATGNDSTDDGYLMGFEISNMSFQSDLISLSACETAIGKFIPGEGTMSLPHFFLQAGAKSILMTHWRVDDRFTSMLMPAFYNQYLNRKLSNVEALRQSKLQIIKSGQKEIPNKYKHPFYWASFALYGVQTMNNFDPKSGSELHIAVILATGLLLFISGYFYFKNLKSRSEKNI